MTAQARLLGGRYQVGELLGYGGMAEVHKGRDLRLGRDVAIKSLRSDLARDATFQERFRREAQNSAALNHPAIVAVYDTGEELSSTGEKLPFIVMEYVNGQTLKEVLAQEQRIQPRRALEMVADICAALEFSHRHGIIHRDIKPGNVMITQNGQVKVMDFGIARALASGATTMTQTSAVIGTAQYLSPEQARGESVDARSDVYAAGCVLFELIIGHPPFVGDSPVSVAYQHVREEPRVPSDILHDLPPEIDAITLKALAKNPLNRYQSAQEMRADALRAVAGRPVLATPVMNEAETMAMQGAPQRQWDQPQAAATTMQRPVSGGAPKRPPQKKSSMVAASVAGLVVLVVIVLVVAIIIGNRNSDGNTDAGKQAEIPTQQMPNLEGMSADEARARLEGLNLRNIKTGNAVFKQGCESKVADQTPQAGTKVPENTQVSFTICNPPEQVTVPEGLKGATRKYADGQLRGAGLDPDFKEVSSSEPKDTVLDVESEGRKVDPGSKITVRISNGARTEMPDVTKQQVEVAKTILKQAGPFDVSTDVVTGVDGAPGTVIKQVPAAGSRIDKGEKVTLTVIGQPPSTQPTSPDPTGSTDPGDDGGAGGDTGGDNGGGIFN